MVGFNGISVPVFDLTIHFYVLLCYNFNSVSAETVSNVHTVCIATSHASDTASAVSDESSDHYKFSLLIRIENTAYRLLSYNEENFKARTCIL